MRSEPPLPPPCAVGAQLRRLQDQEQYRATLRQQVRQWLDLVLAKRNQEWLIVHVTTGNKGGQAAKFYQRKGSLLDKIKADFNIGKRDRSAYPSLCKLVLMVSAQMHTAQSTCLQ